ncbi:MAG: shikimate kinase [Treponemataceae bacterium]
MKSTESAQLIDKTKAEQLPLILMGIKHSGKTTLGKMLAFVMDIPFIDLDDEIEKMQGIGVRKFYETKGQQAFFKAEALACKSIFENNSGCFILATGGGICDNQEALNFIRGFKIFLDVREEICFERILKSAKISGSFPAYITEKNPIDDNQAAQIFHDFYLKRREKYLKITNKILEFEK